MDGKKLEWKKEYSVEVEEIDNQHKHLFVIMNELLNLINNNNTKKESGDIVKSLIEYKIAHFETEEKYFKEFNYDDAEDHIRKHKEFSETLEIIGMKYPKNSAEYIFSLVDFLEDWLIGHIMVTDHKYIKCFHDHGLK
ncbi:MAG: bacteriohemerythrin [Minisyncoccia bacterium]